MLSLPVLLPFLLSTAFVHALPQIVPVETGVPRVAPAAAPSPEPTPAVDINQRSNPIGNVVGGLASAIGGDAFSAASFLGNEVDQLVSEIGGIIENPLSTGVLHNLLTDFELVVATLIPTEIEQATKCLSGIYSATPTPTDIFQFAAQLVEAGLTTNNVKDLGNFISDAASGQNTFTNRNLKAPPSQVYPKVKSSQDAPYSVPESQLRAAIHIPPSFRYGAPSAPQPIILVPGTGSNGYLNFVGNLIPLLTNSTLADPIWLNIPGYQLNDAQVNAEYVAYAIGYIHGISHSRAVAVASWSQGGLSCQWAYKYWPSTRSKVTDQISFSPDYHGTVQAQFAETPGLPLPPAFLQQNYNANFIRTLRANGGDSAYVPTTTIYSSFFDEIVEPQQGTSASAILRDARKVGVSNNEVQAICPGQPGGSLYTHEGVLVNPVAWALLEDALMHPGPGRSERIRSQRLCGDYLAPGLDLTSFLLTENTIPIAALLVLTYESETTVEPPIKAYARKS